LSRDPVNIINPKAISDYLNGFAAGRKNPEVLKAYLLLALEKPLRKDKRHLVPLKRLPEQMPEWLTAQQNAAAFHDFAPSEDLNRKVSHIRDWIEASLHRREPWLEHVDAQGRPLKLLKLGSLEQALHEADKDGEKQRQKHKLAVPSDSSFEYEILHRDIHIVHTFDNGYKIVQILTKVGAARESYLMQHCIADGAYDDDFPDKNPAPLYAFYSLRDSGNNPHATLEVDTQTQYVRQCVGKQNIAPISKYAPYLLDFMKAFQLIYENTSWMGWIFHDGHTYPIEALPEGYTYTGTLDIRPYVDFKCPKNLTVSGVLVMDALQRPFLEPCLIVNGTIVEHYRIDSQTAKVVKHHHAFGRIQSESWLSPETGLHRDGAPAYIDYDPGTGRVLFQKWCEHGKLHRLDGPALQHWNSTSGSLMSESHYIDGHYIKKPQKSG
jgi:hypothetical protein